PTRRARQDRTDPAACPSLAFMGSARLPVARLDGHAALSISPESRCYPWSYVWRRTPRYSSSFPFVLASPLSFRSREADLTWTGNYGYWNGLQKPERTARFSLRARQWKPRCLKMAHHDHCIWKNLPLGKPGPWRSYPRYRHGRTPLGNLNPFKDPWFTRH